MEEEPAAAHSTQNTQNTQGNGTDGQSTLVTQSTPVIQVTREFESVLRYLRTLAEPCAPPMGVGGFDVLYASTREVVVWYSPARDGHTAGEVAIPAEALATAWQSLAAGNMVDVATLLPLGLRHWDANWIIALLAQIPGVQVRLEPLALAWALLSTSNPA